MTHIDSEPGNVRTTPFGPYGVHGGLDCPQEAVVENCSFSAVISYCRVTKQPKT